MNSKQRDTPVFLAAVEESVAKAWRSSFFHLSAFWRGTKWHHHHLQWCHTAGQGSANTTAAPRAVLLSRMGHFPIRVQLISAFLQEDRSAEQLSSLQVRLMKYQNFLILVCEPQFCGREEHATEKIKCQAKSTISYSRRRGHGTLLLHLTVTEEQHCQMQHLLCLHFQLSEEKRCSRRLKYSF